MPDINDIAIELNGSSKTAQNAVDKLIKKLYSLQDAMNIKFGSELTSSLNSLNAGLGNLGRTINNIDAKKVRDVGSALRNLSKNTGRLADLSKLKINTSDAQKQVDDLFGNISAQAKKSATELSEMYNIKDSSNLKELGKRVQEVYNTKGSQDAVNHLESYIKRVGELNKELTKEGEQAKEIRSLLSSGIRMPRNTKSELNGAEEMRYLQGKMGIKNFSYDKGLQWDGAHGWTAIIDDILGGDKFQQMTSPFDALSEAIQFCDEHLNEFVTSASELEALSYHMETLKTEAQGAADAFRQLDNVKVDSDGFMDVGDDFDEETFFTGMADKTEKLAESMNNLSREVEVNPFETLVHGLESLQGLTLPDMSAVGTLASAVGKMSGENVKAAADAIPRIAQGMRAFESVRIPNIEGVSQLASSLRSLGSKRVREATDALPKLFTSLSGVKDITLPNAENIAEFARSIAMLGRQGVEKAIANMPKLADAFSQMASRLSKAPAISANTVRLAQAMGQLSGNALRTGNNIGHASKRLNLFNNMARNGIKSTGGLARTIGKIYATYWLLFRAFGKIKEAIDISSDLTEVQNVVDTVFGDARDKVEEFADSAIMSFGMSELSAKEFASRFQAMGSAMGITDKAAASANEYLSKTLEKTKRNVEGVTDSYKDLGKTSADMSINLSKLAADMGSFYNKDYAEVAEDLNSVYTGMTRPLRTYGLDLTQATLKEWAMTNGLNSNIEKMTQAQKTMLRYQYVMANMGHVMNDYAITANTWANVTRTIGEQFKKLGQLIGEGLINTFKPALIKFRDFLNGLIGLVEKTLNAIGKLLGWQVEITEVGIEGAADGAEDLAGGLGDAADNAKKLNKQLAGFDRLNNLTTPSDGGGSGSGGSGTSGGGGGSSKTTGGKVTYKKYESEIDSWRGLGEAISNKIADELEGINWEKDVYPKAKKFGSGLAEFMNGLFSGSSGKRLFKSLGKTIAGAVNTVMIAADTWAKTLEWSKIGSNIKEGLVKFLKTWKPKIAGSAVGGIVSGIAQAVYSAVSDKKAWDLLGSKISEGVGAFLKTMSKKDAVTKKTGWEALFLGFWDALTGVASAITKVVEDNWDEIAKGIADGIKAVLDDIAKNPKKVTDLIKAGTILAAATSIAGVLGSLLSIKTLMIGIGKLTLSTIGKILLGKGVADTAAVGASGLLGKALASIGVKIGAFINAVKWAKSVSALQGGGFLAALADALGISSTKIAGSLAAGLTISTAITVAAAITWDYKSGNQKKRIDKYKDSMGLNPDGTRKDKKPKTKQDEVNENQALRLGTSYTASSASSANGMWSFMTVLNAVQKEADKNPIDVKVNAKVNKVNQKSLKTKDKTINDCVAMLQDVKKNKLKDKQRTINTIANFNEAKDKIPEKSKDIAATAKFQKWSKGGTFDSDLTGMMAVLEKKKTSKNFDMTIDGMNANITTQTTKSLKKEINKETAIITKQDTSGLTKEINKEKALITKQDTTGLSKIINNETAHITKQTLDRNLNRVIGGQVAKVKYMQDDIPQEKKVIKNVKVVLNSATGLAALPKALGGAFFNNKWHNIPQYASGGLPSHGTMFMAGEAGAEVVGHVGGRTEVLNESQLASTMYSAVSSAMAQQNAILLKQNEYLSGILAKDYGISSRDIFNATRSEANSYFNRTGRPAFEG